MAVKLRLRRLGRKKNPFYRIIAADSRAARDGRFIEEIGHYNPLTEPATVNLKEDRALYWLGVGATPSKTVKNILSRQGIILKFSLHKQGVPEDKITEELKKWEVMQLERSRRLSSRKEEEKERKKKKREESEAAKMETAGEEAAATGSAASAAVPVEQTAAPEEVAAEPEVPAAEASEGEVRKVEETPAEAEDAEEKTQN